MEPKRKDPVLESSLREAKLIFLVWAAAFAYTVTYCYLFGYDRDPETITFYFGFPDWVFWGIITPWLACIVISYWISHHFMTDEDLGTDPAEQTEQTEATQ